MPSIVSEGLSIGVEMIAAVQILGLFSAWATRCSEGSAWQGWFQQLFFVSLLLVGLTTVAAVGLGPGYWISCGADALGDGRGGHLRLLPRGRLGVSRDAPGSAAGAARSFPPGDRIPHNKAAVNRRDRKLLCKTPSGHSPRPGRSLFSQSLAEGKRSPVGGAHNGRGSGLATHSVHRSGAIRTLGLLDSVSWFRSARKSWTDWDGFEVPPDGLVGGGVRSAGRVLRMGGAAEDESGEIRYAFATPTIGYRRHKRKAS